MRQSDVITILIFALTVASYAGGFFAGAAFATRCRHDWTEWDQPATSQFGTTLQWHWRRSCRRCGKVQERYYG